jgi:predicted nucleotidyltransferase
MGPDFDLAMPELVGICRRFRVRTLEIFGSSLRDDFDPARSDLDFLVEFEDVPVVQFADLFFGLQETLSALFQLPVDLLTPESITNPFLLEGINQSRKVLYAA